MKRLLLPFIIIAIAIASNSCANRGIGPQGGPIDSIPPRLVRSSPLNGTLNYDKQQIDIAFDEYIQLDNPSDNIIFSPPQKQQPEVSARGKKIRIRYKDTLEPATTYTIDFGNAVQDNNERNPMENFSFHFSTGNNMDSLEVYGTLIDAETLNPLQGIVIGLHTDLSDTALLTRPFTRIGKTNDEGEFVIRNVSEGTYRLYALQDLNRDYIYQPGEKLAFIDTTITPYINIRTEIDTVWRDTVVNDTVRHLPDSIYTAEYFYYEPSDLLLTAFSEDKQHIYLDRVVRDQRNRFTLIFNGSQTTPPQVHALNRDSLTAEQDWLIGSVVQTNTNADTITYWLTDTTALKTDSLLFAVSYTKTDSTYLPQQHTDTLWTVYRATQAEKNTRKKKKKKDKETPEIPSLAITSNARDGFEIYDTIRLTSATPILSIDAEHITLQQQKDTLWQDLPFTLQNADEAKTQWFVISRLQPKVPYKMSIDSAAIEDIYHLTNKQQTFSWQLKPASEYATLRVLLEDDDPRVIVQLLGENDQPKYQQRAQQKEVKFRNLKPGTYYMRLFIDLNGDGRWTTGEVLPRRQPEPVYYFRKKLNLRANWDFEETFTWHDTPILQQKPRALIKKGKGNGNSASEKK